MIDTTARVVTRRGYGWQFRDGVLLITGRRWSIVCALAGFTAVFALAAWYTWGGWIAWMSLGAAFVGLIGIVDTASKQSSLRYEVRGDRLVVKFARFGRAWQFHGSGREVLRLETTKIDSDPPAVFDVCLVAALPRRRVPFQLNVMGVQERDVGTMIDDWQRRLGLPATSAAAEGRGAHLPARTPTQRR